jgi:16S rRNA G966 N2-methylase RsmD
MRTPHDECQEQSSSLLDYQSLKHYYNNTLNLDRSSFQSSNDEPTPIDCVEEMMDSIPHDFWLLPNLRILDPCCGNGNFGLVARTRMRPDASLYCNDTNVERLQVVANVFGSVQTPPVHISHTNFLTEFKTPDKFDLIMANPPYAKIDASGKRASKNHNLIGSFIRRSLELLRTRGFLLYIVPDNWMSYSDRNTLISILTGLQIHVLNIHQAKKYFKKIGSSFTWFLIENVPAYADFRVDGIWKGVMYSSMVHSQVRRFIPLYYTSTIQSLLSKTIDADNQKFHIETTSFLHHYTKRQYISTIQDDEHPYRLIHTPKQTCYSSVEHKYQYGYKVFISATDKYHVFIDDCGMTQSIMFIRCSSLSEANHVRSILKHPLYKFLNDICRWGNFNNIRVLQRFPVPTDPTDIPGSFNLTEQEMSVYL